MVFIHYPMHLLTGKKGYLEVEEVRKAKPRNTRKPELDPTSSETTGRLVPDILAKRNLGIWVSRPHRVCTKETSCVCV